MKSDARLIIIIGILTTLLFMNYVGDVIYRLNNNEQVERMVDNWETQSHINENNNNIHDLVPTVLEQMDKDIKSNMKVVDQLIGIILRNGEV